MKTALLSAAVALAAIQMALGLAGVAGGVLIFGATVCGGSEIRDDRGNLIESTETCEDTPWGQIILYAGLAASVTLGGAIAAAGLLGARQKPGVAGTLLVIGTALAFPLVFFLPLLLVPFLMAAVGTAAILNERPAQTPTVPAGRQ